MGRPPKYQTLVGLICEDIAEGNLSQGIHAQGIAHRYGVSRNTALKALKILHSCNFITLSKGRSAELTLQKSSLRHSNRSSEHPTSPEKLESEILRRIQNGHFGYGIPLPKIHFFVSEFGVSPHTVIQAFRRLEGNARITKKGKQWIVGAHRHVPEQGPLYPQTICIIQNTTSSYARLFSNTNIWANCFAAFHSEVEKHAVRLQSVLFKTTEMPDTIPSGKSGFAKVVNEAGSRYIGSIVISDTDTPDIETIGEWLSFTAQYGRRVLFPCIHHSWTKLEQNSDLPPNVKLALYGDWKYSKDRSGMAGQALDILFHAGHRRVLFIDTVYPREEWVSRRLRNLNKHADQLTERLQFHTVLGNGALRPVENSSATTHLLQSLCASDNPRLSSFARKIVRMHEIDKPFKQLSDVEQELCVDASVILPALEKYAPTAIIAPNDYRAARYYRLFRVLGISVPSNISLISYDNSPLLRPFPISSIDFGLTSLGFQMFHSFFNHISLRYFGKNGNMLWGESRLNHGGSVGRRSYRRATLRE